MRGVSRVRRTSLVRTAAKGSKDVDWDAKTKEMTAERVLEQCMEAMADGDEDRLERGVDEQGGGRQGERSPGLSQGSKHCCDDILGGRPADSEHRGT